MTSCADILRHVPKDRLRDLAAEHAPGIEVGPEGLAGAAGDRLLEMLASLDGDDLAEMCVSLDIDPSELARLAAPPRTRGDCESGLRPCPYKTCRYHLPATQEASCALDLAEEGGLILEDIGRSLGVTRERARQIEVAALTKAVKPARALGLDEVWRPDETPEGGRKPQRSEPPRRNPDVRRDGNWMP